MKETTIHRLWAGASQAGQFAALQRVWEWAVRRRWEFAALAMYVFILILRAPWVPLSGRFWAEEGTIYLAYAWSHSFFDALTAGHLGYYNLVPNVAGIVGAHVPLEDAARYTVLIALLVQLLPAALILFSSIPGLTTPACKGAVLLLMLVVPANPGVFLTTINCNLLLCASTAFILISEHGGKIDRVSKWGLLALGGLDGVVSTFLTPFFWFVWWKERRRERLEQAAILTGCALLQFVVAIQALSSGERNLEFDHTVLAATVYGKFIVTPLLPARPAFWHLDKLAQGLNHTGGLPAAVWLVTLLVFAGFLAACWWSGKRAALLLAAAAFWVVLLSFVASQGTHNVDRLIGHINSELRYYYTPQVLFFSALLLCVSPDSRLPNGSRAVIRVWIGVVLVMGCFNYACAPLDWPGIFSGPPWAQQVKRWRQDPSKPLAIWPESWQVTLPPKP